MVGGDGKYVIGSECPRLVFSQYDGAIFGRIESEIDEDRNGLGGARVCQVICNSSKSFGEFCSLVPRNGRARGPN